MRILERIADAVFPLMLYIPIYLILILLRCPLLISVFGAFVGSVALMFLASAVDDVLYKRRMWRELRRHYGISGTNT